MTTVEECREWPGKHYEKLRYCPHCGAKVVK